MKFKEFGFAPALMEGLDAMGFEDATPVQEQAIPPILEGRDVLAVAQTGTGKTAAFLLPILNALSVDPPEGVSTIIVEPTRELAIQVDQQLEGFSYFTSVSSIAIYGGRGGQEMEQEKRALKKGAAIIVATPGRLKSHLDLGYVDLKSIRHLILDEADRMLDMGFAPDIMHIVNKLPRDRQTLLFSATMPPVIRKFARQLMRNPAEVNIAISKPAEKILQAVYEVEDEGKNHLIEHLLERADGKKRVLIFAGTKRTVRDLASSLQRKSHQIAAIHSDLEQKDREEALLSFKSGAVPIVVATDVLSRGIDISGIDVVINYDVPNDAEDYIHRIGRTARAEASGVALTLVNGKDCRRFQRIEELMEMKVMRAPLPPGIPGKLSTPCSERSKRRSYGSRNSGGSNRGSGQRSNRRNNSGRSSNRRPRNK